jgi:hypothetical protein
MRFSTSLAALLVPFALARSSSQSAQKIQVYLHPSPSSPHAHAPTLSADQAKAVLSHHLGGQISDFDEIPADEGMWGHLVGMWNGQHGLAKQVDGAKVVIVDGASSQGKQAGFIIGESCMLTVIAVLPTNLQHEPSFYLQANDDARSLFAPYIERAQSFFTAILDKMPEYVKDFVDGLEMTGTSESYYWSMPTPPRRNDGPLRA